MSMPHQILLVNNDFQDLLTVISKWVIKYAKVHQEKCKDAELQTLHDEDLYRSSKKVS